jgi:hypothetical protein
MQFVRRQEWGVLRRRTFRISNRAVASGIPIGIDCRESMTKAMATDLTDFDFSIEPSRSPECTIDRIWTVGSGDYHESPL